MVSGSGFGVWEWLGRTARWGWVQAVVAVGVGAAALLAAPALASAQTTCPSTPGPQSVTFSYSSPGGAQTCVIPAGVTSITVDAYGAQGGTSYAGTAGGEGAYVHATVPVAPGTLEVFVGSAGGSNGNEAGGFNGGGGGPYIGSAPPISGGGGGASDLRDGSFGLADRLVVAGGGGGGGGTGNGVGIDGTGGGEGGGGGASNTVGDPGAPTPDVSGGGGGGAGDGMGGAGGLGGSQTNPGVPVESGAPGSGGTLGQGGSSGSQTELLGGDGGGGGGGYYGGGGGGSGADNSFTTIGSGGGGGGGGSSFIETSATGTSTDGVQAGDGQVTISYTVPAPAACTNQSVSTPYQTPTTVTFSCTGTGLTYTLVSPPAHGTLNAISNGEVTYTPNAGYSGPDSFEVRATDSDNQTATDTVTVTVGAPTSKLADVSVSLSGPGHAPDGGTFNETITVKNAGPAPATNVITALVVPRGLTVTNPGGGRVIGSTVSWTAGSITAGHSVTYTVGLKVAAGARTSVKLAAASGSTQVKDPNYANNAAITTVTLGH